MARRVHKTDHISNARYLVDFENNLAAAVQDFNDNGGNPVFIVSENITVSQTLTVPFGTVLQIQRGAVITVAAEMTLYIDAFIDAGVYQIFDTSASNAAVIKGDNKIDRQDVFPEWWGADIDENIFDNAPFINAALDFGTGDVVLAEGIYNIITEIDMGGFSGYGRCVRGQGIASTQIRTIGNTGNAAIHCGGTAFVAGSCSYYSTFRDFSMQGNGLTAYAFDCDLSIGLKFINIYITNFTTAGWYCPYIWYGIWENCWTGTVDYGIWLHSTNTRHCVVEKCQLGAKTPATSTTAGLRVSNGCYDNTVANTKFISGDFGLLGERTTNLLITGCQFDTHENSHIKCTNYSGIPCSNVIIQASTFRNLDPDNGIAAFDFDDIGAAKVIGCASSSVGVRLGSGVGPVEAYASGFSGTIEDNGAIHFSRHESMGTSRYYASEAGNQIFGIDTSQGYTHIKSHVNSMVLTADAYNDVYPVVIGVNTPDDNASTVVSGDHKTATFGVVRKSVLGGFYPNAYFTASGVLGWPTEYFTHGESGYMVNAIGSRTSNRPAAIYTVSGVVADASMYMGAFAMPDSGVNASGHMIHSHNVSRPRLMLMKTGSDTPDQGNMRMAHMPFLLPKQQISNSGTMSLCDMGWYKENDTFIKLYDFGMDGNLELTSGDVETQNYNNGLVLRDSDGGRWRVTVGTDGALTTTAL